MNETAAAEEKVSQATHRTAPADVAHTRATASLQYVAMKPMKVNGVKVAPGEIVPAASTWRNVHNYVSTGHLAVVGS